MLIEDEIAIIARVTMSLGDGCQHAIDDHIARALSTGEWDEMSKWHRVRARVGRLQRQMTREDATELANATLRPNAARS